MFVDDDADLLAALATSLRRKRRVWDMQFVRGGRAAVELLGSQPWDAIVTDMKMPELDGEAVLEAALAARPETIRIVLSGQAERSTAVRALGLAHRFVYKPCSLLLLQDCLSRLMEVCGGLEAVDRRVACGAGYLSAPQAVLRGIQQSLGQSAFDPIALTRRFECDLGLSAKLLHMVNGGFFGHVKAVASVEAAISCLSPELIAALVAFTPTQNVSPHAAPDAALGAGADVDGVAAPQTQLSCGAAWMEQPMLERLGRTAIEGYGRSIASDATVRDEDHRAWPSMNPTRIGAALAALWGLGLGCVAPSDGWDPGRAPETTWYESR
jgi:CheY-like chemotaxis protein